MPRVFDELEGDDERAVGARLDAGRLEGLEDQVL